MAGGVAVRVSGAGAVVASEAGAGAVLAGEAGASGTGYAGGTTGHASGSAAQSTANRTRLTLEAVVALLTTGENTTLLLEVGHADRWESGGSVVLRGVVVNLMDGNGGVDDGRQDDLCKVHVSARL